MDSQKSHSFSTKSFYDFVVKHGLYSSGAKLEFYLKKYIFRGIPLSGKRLIDIGGGSGLFSFHCLHAGLESATILEPGADGSAFGISKQFEVLLEYFDNTKKISLIGRTVQEFHPTVKYDVVLMHNSINHLNEKWCQDLHLSLEYMHNYQLLLKNIIEFCIPGAYIIVCDCARRNFWGDLNMKNPFAPNIEWYKHQQPDLWCKLFGKLNCKSISLEWSSPNRLKRLGRFMLGNRVMSYFLYSHFRLVFQKKPEKI